MAGPLTQSASTRTISTNANLLQDMFLFKRFVDPLRKRLVSYQLGQRDDLPARSGVNVRWQFWQNPAISTTPLTEGTDPTDSRALDTTKVEAAIAQYGDFFEITDKLEATAVDGAMVGFVDAASYAAKLVIDTLILIALSSTTSEVDAGTAVTANDIRLCAAKLDAADAKFHRSTPGGQYYCAILSSEAGYDLVGEGSPTWSEAKQMAVDEHLRSPLDGTPGNSAVYNVIIKTSTNVQRDTGTSPDDDLNYVIADQGFGVTTINSNLDAPEVSIVPAKPSLASPLGMRGTVGWKIFFQTKLLDSARVVELKSDATGVGA